MANQLITFQGIAGVYRFLTQHNPDYTVPSQALEDCLTHLYLFASEKASVDIKKLAIQRAIESFTSLIKEMQAHVPQSAFSYQGKNREIAQLTEDTAYFAGQVKGVTATNLQGVIKQVREVAKTHFQGRQIRETLQEEVRRQEELLRLPKLCEGFLGFYELVAKRYNLQYDLIGRGVWKFLPTVATYTVKVIQSFTEKRESISENEGMTHLKTVIAQVSAHPELTGLCHQGSPVPFFIENLLTLQNDPAKIESLYKDLREEFRDQVRDVYFDPNPLVFNEVDSAKLLTFFDDKATEISARIPDDLVGTNRQIADQLVRAFQGHREAHGDGALLYGTERPGVRFVEQTIGEGIHDGGFNFVAANPFNGNQLDQLAPNQKMREKAEELGQKLVNDYYNFRRLSEVNYTMHESIVEERPARDPIEQALSTIGAVINYEIEEYTKKYRHDHLIIGALPVAQIEAIRPQMAKKVILFGVRNDMFNKEQIVTALRACHLDKDDPEIAPVLEEARNRYLLRLAEESKESKDLKRKAPPE